MIPRERTVGKGGFGRSKRTPRRRQPFGGLGNAHADAERGIPPGGALLRAEGDHRRIDAQYQALIFGSGDSDGAGAKNLGSISDDFQSIYDAAENAYRTSVGYDRQRDDGTGTMEYVNRDKEGLFNWHVGYAPQMKSDEPEKVEEDGYGEMGRIMREFMINEARAQRGLSILDTPGYALKLWDDDADNDGESDGFFGAPSIKDLTNIAVSVVAYSAGVGPLLTAAINLADDALFTALDVGTGYRDAGDAWGSFGVQAASAVASSSIGGAFNGFVGADTAAKAVTDGSQSFWTHGMNGLIDRSMADATGFFGSSFVSTSIDIGMNATQSIATNAASSAISSYDFSNWEFDDKKIYESTFGKSAWAGYAGSAASTAFTAGLNWSVDGTLGRDLAQVRSLNQLAGSAVNAGIQYRMTGSTTLNVLSASDLSGGSLRGGLLELHLGEGGTGMNLGSGGIGMSAVQVANSIGGLKTYGRNVRIAANGYWGKEAVAARMLATSGLTETEDLFDQLMNGEAELAYGGTDGRAETRVANGLKTIHLGDGASAGSRYQLGLTLSHEAFRNGLDDGNAGQQLETVNAVIGHSRVAQLVAGAYGEDNLSETQRGEVALLEYAQHTGDISALAAHAIGSYDSGADYWKLVQNAEGNWGWREDGNLDFDLSELSPDKRAAVEEALRLSGSGLTSGGRVRHEDMDGTMMDIVARGVTDAPAREPGVFRMGPDTSRHADALARFRYGTQQFVNVSKIAAGLMRGGVSADGITSLDEALVSAQRSGLLIENEARISTDGLINVGVVDQPVYVPVRLGYGDDVHTVTSYPGLRIVDPERGITRHSGIDIGRVHDSDVVAAADESTLGLTWDAVYGLSARNGFSIEGNSYENRLGHLEVNKTLMDYIAAFGAEGVKATGDGLAGLPAGMVIGQVGNTGYSLGEHLDWRTFRNTRPENPLDSRIYGDYLSTAPATLEARLLSNLPGRTPEQSWQMPETWDRIDEYWRTTRDVDWLWDLGVVQ